MRDLLSNRASGFGRLVVSLLSVMALGSQARAGPGLNLSWDHCGADGVSSKVFACDTNEGNDVFVASLVVDASPPPFTEVRAYIAFRFDTRFLPEWWAFTNPLDCRLRAVTASLVHDPGSDECSNPWGTTTTFEQRRGSSLSSTALLALFQIRPGVTVQLSSDSHVFLFNVVVSHKSTVDPSPCTGCQDGVEITFEWVDFLNEGTLVNTTTEVAARKVITWNGGLLPTHRTSWGQIKALYR